MAWDEPCCGNMVQGLAYCVSPVTAISPEVLVDVWLGVAWGPLFDKEDIWVGDAVELHSIGECC